MNGFSKALSAAAITLWIGTFGGGIVGYNIGSKLDDTAQTSSPVASVSEAPVQTEEPQPSESSTAQPPPSPQGETGAQGPAGADGQTGPQGVRGLPGPMGPAGPQGETGSTGAVGPIGPTGLSGSTGATGATGAMGPAGPAGATGPMGPVGPQGPSGVALAQLPATYDAATKTVGVDQSAFEFLANLGYLKFNTSSTASGQIGRLKWNATDGTLDLSLGGGQVTLQVGQEMVQPVKNVTAGTLLNGRAVRISGADSGRMTVEYADATDPTKTTGVIGILTQDIAPGEVGFVTTTGLVRELDTSFGQPGTPVYVNGSGILVSVRPALGAVMVIGHIVASDASSGSIFVDTSTTFTPGAGLPCNAGPTNAPGVYKWETAGAGDYYLSCDITP